MYNPDYKREEREALHITIDMFGGNCPVQAEGFIKGAPFYFRSRGESWSFGVGDDPVGNPNWEHMEFYGVWPDAGWITEEQAMDFIIKAATMWTEGKEPGKLTDDTERWEQRDKAIRDILNKMKP